MIATVGRRQKNKIEKKSKIEATEDQRRKREEQRERQALNIFNKQTEKGKNNDSINCSKCISEKKSKTDKNNGIIPSTWLNFFTFP